MQKLGHNVEECPKISMQPRSEPAEGPNFIQFIPETSCRRPVVIDGIMVFIEFDTEGHEPDQETATMTAADAQSARAEQSVVLALVIEFESPDWFSWYLTGVAGGVEPCAHGLLFCMPCWRHEVEDHQEMAYHY